MVALATMASTKVREGVQTEGALPTAQGGAPAGGTTGQALVKTSNSDYVYDWGTVTPTGAALTRVDDTNVTVTLGGTPASALLQAVSLTLGWSGQLAVSRGGTGAATAGAHTFFANNTGSTAAPSFTSFVAGTDYWDTTVFPGGNNTGLVPPAVSVVPPCVRFLNEDGIWQCPGGGGSSGGAPDDAHYLTNQAESGLTDEINLGALSTGLLKGTVSVGVSTISSITDNSSNWDTAFSERRQWDGGSTNLVAATGRTSLGLVIGTDVQAWDTQLDSLATLSYSGNSLKIVRVNSGETGFELATISTTTTGTIGFTSDGAGITLTTGTKGYFTTAFSGTITGWSISATGSSPTCTIDVWKIGTGTALPTVSNTITASAKPALSTGNAIRSSTLTGWTTSFSAGDIFGFNIDAVTVATKITFSLEVTH